MVGVLKTNTNFERMIVYFVRLYVVYRVFARNAAYTPLV